MSDNAFIKDPQAKLDYAVDWSAWLDEDDDTIGQSDWTVPGGLTEVSASTTGTLATVWLSGGVVGEVYEVVNHIVTAAGREDDRTIFIHVADK